MTTPNYILVNSLPKSGTHLLAKTIEALGYTEHFQNNATSTPNFLIYKEVKQALALYQSTTSDTIAVGTLAPIQVNIDILSAWLQAMPNNSYIIGHICYNAMLSNLLQQQHIGHIAIIRDPRAVIASLLAFILDSLGMPNPHFLQNDFKQRTISSQLDLLLEGGYAPLAQEQIKPFKDFFYDFWAWNQENSTLLIKFEDLVGIEGGGSMAQQTATIAKIAKHLAIEITPSIQENCKTIYNTKSRTFRIGKIDAWKATLDKKSIERIETYCQPLCEISGYV